MKKKIFLVAFMSLMFLAQMAVGAGTKVGEQIHKDTRCPVCGMFVAKYQEWLVQLSMSDGSIETFDGVKDMMAYHFSPHQFGGGDGVTVVAVSIRDYYSQEWSDGREAMYVLGSDVYGPMGHELVPFASRAGAENFLKDHHGKQIVSFTEITPELIESLRKGHKMKKMQ